MNVPAFKPQREHGISIFAKKLTAEEPQRRSAVLHAGFGERVMRSRGDIEQVETTGSAVSLQTPEAFLSGGGELGERIRQHDWSGADLGEPSQWPQSLKTAIRIMLASRQPIWIGWGPDLCYFYNDPYKSIIGGKHPWALGRPTREVWAEIWTEIAPLLDTALAGQEGTYSEEQLLIMERHGYQEETYYTFSYTSIPNDEGGVGGIICANTDDTQRVIAERQLALLKELAGSASSSTSAAEGCALSAKALSVNRHDLPFAIIYLIDGEGNAKLVGTSGIAPDHPAVSDVLSPNGDTQFPVFEALDRREMIVFDLPEAAWPKGPWNRQPSKAAVLPILPAGEGGRTAVIVAGLNPMRRLDDNFKNFLDLIAGQLASNIARADAFEEESRRVAALADIDRAKTVFFSNTSHELRTPLTLMLGPLQELLRASGGSDVVAAPRADLELMQRNGARLLKLVNTLLDFSRIEAGKAQAVFEPVDLASFTAQLASTFSSAMERAELGYTVHCPPLSDAVYVDRDMWEKIVLNLLSNAFKYTLTGGISVSLQDEESRVVLNVRDSGVGIPEDQIEHLFDRFHRIPGQRGRSQEGTGIGLALVKELVRMHGGEISVASDAHGSCFRVALLHGKAHLPEDHVRDRSHAEPATGGPTSFATTEAMRWLDNDPIYLSGTGEFPPVPDSTNGPHRPTVLLADDNADMRDYVKRILSRHVDVEVVADGQAALDAARKGRPDLVLSDVMMPGLDGFALVRSLRSDEALRDIPIILLSARAGEEASVDGLGSGADDYLVKPFSARELLARVRAKIDLSALRREALRTETELRRKAEVAQEHADSILSSISDGFMALDAEWRFSYINAAAERMLGRRAAELIGKDHWQEYPNVPGSSLEASYRRVMNERVSLSFENYYEPWDRWFDLRLFPTSDGGISIYFQDVTARKRAELDLREKNLELHTVLDATPAAVWIARDPECRVITGNLAAAKLLDLEPDRNASKSADASEAPRNFKIMKDGIELAPEDLPIQRAARHGEVVRGFEEEIVFEDGSVLHLYGNAEPLRDASGKVRGAVGAFMDITELAKARQLLADRQGRLEETVALRTAELRENEARLRTIFQTSFSYQGFMAPDGTLLSANATSLEGLGIDLDGVVGKPFWETAWFTGTPGMPERIRKAVPEVANGAVLREEIHLFLPVGGWRWFDFQMRPVRNDAGEVVAIIPEAVETTARRAAEDGLRQAQKMEAIGQLTGGVAHDFNNLLTIVRSSADLLRKRDLPEERRKRYVDAIADTADRAAKITGQLLAFSRRQALQAHVFDVGARISSIAEMLSTVLGARISLQWSQPVDVFAVEADSNQFETALVNLVVNARDAMDGSGELRIGVTKGRREGTAELVMVTVSDTGCGIPRDQIDKIFDPFFTTKEIGQGTGLGLSQVYGFAKQSGGSVEVASQPGEGTTFTLVLPRSDKPVPVVIEQRDEPQDMATNRGRVLIVEDNPEVGDFTCQVFDELGYEAVLVPNAEQALRILDEQADSFKVVFSDVMMPGMSGIELGGQLRSRFPTMPLLLTSGYSEVLANDGPLGFELLQKPYTVEALSAALQRATRPKS